MKPFRFGAFALLTGCAAVAPHEVAAPAVDYHQHLVSPAFAPLANVPGRDGAALLREMDQAGIRRAVVLSVGYTFADERKKLPEPDSLTHQENDWTAAQVRASRGRLIGFCSVNPLRDRALAELERCLALPGMVGIKQHFGNSGVTLRNAGHLARMQQLLALADRKRAPVLIHMRARGGTNYGAEDARIFIDQLLPLIHRSQVIVAHLGSAGPGYEQADEVMAVFAGATARGNPNLRNLYFDVATNVTEETSAAEAALIARRLRQVGVGKILYGSDLSPPGGSIRSGWDIFRSKLPLTPAEVRTIARNRPRFAR